MSAESFRQKAREIAYLLARVSYQIKRQSLRSRIEELAVLLAEYAAKSSVLKDNSTIASLCAVVSALDVLVRYGHSLYEIEPVNATSLVHELHSFNSAIRQFAELPNADIAELPNYGNNEDEKRKGKEKFSKKMVKTTDESGNRQSDILEKVKSGNIADLELGKLSFKLKDVIAAFPGISERTLRYDLQRLCEQAVFERIGEGGPGTYYRVRQETEGLVEIPTLAEIRQM